MRVSVALHSDEPDTNQRQHEASYRDYNRAYADLAKNGNGGVCKFRDLKFPKVGADPVRLTHFSIGICEGAPDTGGTIIAIGVLAEPIMAEVGDEPTLSSRMEVAPAVLEALGLKL